MSTRRIRWSVLTNLAAGAWNSILGLLFVPVYLHSLGIEAYGLVGFFTLLQGILGLLDLGLGVTLTRSLARLTARSAEAGALRDTVRTYELTFWSLAALGCGIVFLLAGPLAGHWVRSATLSSIEITTAVRVIAAAAALQLPISLYRAALLGLDRQPLMNAVTVLFATLRQGGAALVAIATGSILSFMWWQAAVALVHAVTSAIVVWRCLPAGREAHARVAILKDERKFAATVFGNALIGIALTQSDKVLLSGMLSLRDFGYYTLASTLAMALITSVIAPFNTASYTRFAALFEIGEENGMRDLYHTVCQFLALVIMPSALTLAFFSRQILQLWTHNAETAAHSALLLSILVIGTVLNAISSVATYLQSAAGWPQLMMYTNLGAILLIIPALLAAVKWAGAPGAAAVWVALNLSYILVAVPLMHRRLLRGEGWRWLRHDVLVPLFTAGAVLAIARWALPWTTSGLAAAVTIAGAFCIAALATAAVLPRVRHTLLALLHNVRMRSLRA